MLSVKRYVLNRTTCTQSGSENIDFSLVRTLYKADVPVELTFERKSFQANIVDNVNEETRVPVRLMQNSSGLAPYHCTNQMSRDRNVERASNRGLAANGEPGFPE